MGVCGSDGGVGSGIREGDCRLLCGIGIRGNTCTEELKDGLVLSVDEDALDKFGFVSGKVVGRDEKFKVENFQGDELEVVDFGDVEAADKGKVGVVVEDVVVVLGGEQGGGEEEPVDVEGVDGELGTLERDYVEVVQRGDEDGARTVRVAHQPVEVVDGRDRRGAEGVEGRLDAGGGEGAQHLALIDIDIGIGIGIRGNRPHGAETDLGGLDGGAGMILAETGVGEAVGDDALEDRDEVGRAVEGIRAGGGRYDHYVCVWVYVLGRMAKGE